MPTSSPALPSADLLEQQAQWLAPARARLLRRAAIAHKRTVLDLGSGRGTVTPELTRRSGGLLYALDSSYAALHEIEPTDSVLRVAGNAARLPFANESLALIFSQYTLLWVDDVVAALAEIWRALEPGGVLCAIEPDYPSLIEFPPDVAVADVWQAALSRCGANIDIGRRLPTLLERQGFSFEVLLLDQLKPPSPLRYALLRELPLSPGELAVVERAKQESARLGGWQQVAHLPLFLINAHRPQ